MTNTVLERAHSLKQDLVNFVYDAEGAVAETLETYAAEQLKRRKLDPDLLLDCFLTEGQVGDRTVWKPGAGKEHVDRTRASGEFVAQSRRPACGEQGATRPGGQRAASRRSDRSRVRR